MGPTPTPTATPGVCAGDPDRLRYELCPGGDCPNGIGEPGFVVQMLSNNPDADLDLSVTRGGVGPQQCADSCWFKTCDSSRPIREGFSRPDWCDEGPDGGDPVLDHDSQGCRPETIRIVDPCEQSVDVWVSRNGDSPTPVNATVRAFCAGRLVAEFASTAPVDALTTWRVATLTLPSCAVTTHDERMPLDRDPRCQ